MGFCGPGKGLGDWLVPDSILGVDISGICESHDIDYAMGFPKDDVDLLFLIGMQVAVRERAGLLMPVRLFIVKGYYLAVRYFGKSSWLKAQGGVNELS